MELNKFVSDYTILDTYERMCSMKRKRGIFHLSKYYLLVLLLFFVVYNTNMSVAIDSLEVERGSDMQIASNKKAFIGVDYKNQYVIDQGEKISFYVKNNFPSRAEFILTLDGDIISEYDPENFQLSPNGGEEKIEIITDKEAEPGVYQIEGSISAEFGEGRSDVEIAIEVEVKEPVIVITAPEAEDTSEEYVKPEAE